MTNLKLALALTLVGIAGVLILPGLPISWAAAKSEPPTQEFSLGALDGPRQTSLRKLYNHLKSGDSFSEEEALILKKFAEGGMITDLEADVVIARALYDFYVANNELTREQQELFDHYKLFVARRTNDVADLKTSLLNKRIAAEAAAGPRLTPLVAPANDLCAGAEVIPAAGPFPHLTAVTADITDATVTGDPPLPSCQTSASRSIWYTFTPATTADYIIGTCADGPAGTTVDDTVMGIYTSAGGCTFPFNELPTAGATIGCDDDTCAAEAFQSVIQTRLNAGTQYFIVVWQFGSAAPLAGNTAVQLRVSQVAVPANDVCTGATPLTLNTPVNGTTIGAGPDYVLSGSPCFTGFGNTPSIAQGREVVYSFTAPAAGDYSFKVTNYSVINNLVVYFSTSCPAPGTLLCGGAGPVFAAANRRTTGSSEEVFCRPVGSGQQVFIFVDENAVSSGSTFKIEATACATAAEPNDTPATAATPSFGIEGSISPGTDVDFYSLGTPPTGSRIFAMVDGVAASLSDFDLRLTTATDTLEYDDFNNDDAFGSLAPNIAGTPTNGTPSFLRVSPRDGVEREPYRLYSVVQPPLAAATPESEPNNTIGGANFALNNYFTGALSGPSSDVDIFRFTATAGDLVFLSLDGDPLRDNTPLNASLELLDSNGVSLIAVDDPASTSSTASGAGSLTATTPNSPAESLVFRITATGTYHVSVSAIASAGDYLLSIANATAVGADTMGLYNPAAGAFFLRNANTSGVADITFSFGPAGAGFVSIAGDWDGDGVDTAGIYNPATGAFFLRNSNSTGVADIAFNFGPGGQGIVPIVGDWNADGADTIGIYNPATGAFFLRNSNSSGIADILFNYGPAGAGFVPLTGDWDGDGTDTIGLYDPANGAFFLRNSNTTGTAGITFSFGPGGAGLRPIAGDWNGDGMDTVGLYNPSTGAFFLRNSNSSGTADISLTYGPGGAGFTPIVGDWDGL